MVKTRKPQSVPPREEEHGWGASVGPDAGPKSRGREDRGLSGNIQPGRRDLSRASTSRRADIANAVQAQASVFADGNEAPASAEARREDAKGLGRGASTHFSPVATSRASCSDPKKGVHIRRRLSIGAKDKGADGGIGTESREDRTNGRSDGAMMQSVEAPSSRDVCPRDLPGPLGHRASRHAEARGVGGAAGRDGLDVKENVMRPAA